MTAYPFKDCSPVLGTSHSRAMYSILKRVTWLPSFAASEFVCAGNLHGFCRPPVPDIARTTEGSNGEVRWNPRNLTDDACLFFFFFTNRNGSAVFFLTANGCSLQCGIIWLRMLLYLGVWGGRDV